MPRLRKYSPVWFGKLKNKKQKILARFYKAELLNILFSKNVI
jgi:hypothetical protein